MDTIKIDKKNTKMVAHRGLSGLELMNTCAAFVAAGNRDYYGIETDVHLTSDGKYVVYHDGHTGNLAGGKMVLEETDFETLRGLQLHDKNGNKRIDMKIPSLEEYIDICAKYEKHPVLELKNRFPKRAIKKMLKVIAEHIDMSQMVFISFDYQNMVNLRQLLPDAELQFLWYGGKSGPISEKLVKMLKDYNLDLDTHEKDLTKENLDMLHENGIKVNAWTVDNPERAQELCDWGIDFITSNIIQ